MAVLAEPAGHAATLVRPPAQLPRLREDTRLRADLTADRTRQEQRLEQRLEDALIKLATVATDILGVSGRAMIEALIAGQRDPKMLAELARGRLRVKHAALVQALTAASTTITPSWRGCWETRSTP